MTEDEIRARVIEALASVAPDAAETEIEPGVKFRDQFDFDSMDSLNFAIALSKAFGIDIPERDYARLASLDGCIAYLSARAQGRP